MLSLTERLLSEESIRLRELPLRLRKEAALSIKKYGRAYYDSNRKEITRSRRGDCCVAINDSPGNVSAVLSEGTRFIHLKGIGKVPAILARELKPGDILSWNNAPDSYEVKSVEPISSHYLSVSSEEAKSGKSYIQKMKKDKLVAVKRVRPAEDS